MAESVFAERIVQNLLDTDFYKLTMMQAVLHNYPNAEVEWEFRCRNAEDCVRTWRRSATRSSASPKSR